MKKLIFATLALLSISGFAQEKGKPINNRDINVGKPYNTDDKVDNIIYNSVGLDTKPQYADGGLEGFYNFFNSNFRKPNIPENKAKDIKVYASFVVEKDGSLSNIKILRDPGYGIGNEVLRVLQLSAKWIPGQHSDKLVRTAYNLPLIVKL